MAGVGRKDAVKPLVVKGKGSGGPHTSNRWARRLAHVGT